MADARRRDNARSGYAPPPMMRGPGGPRGPGWIAQGEKPKDMKRTLLRLWVYFKR